MKRLWEWMTSLLDEPDATYEPEPPTEGLIDTVICYVTTVLIALAVTYVVWQIGFR